LPSAPPLSPSFAPPLNRHRLRKSDIPAEKALPSSAEIANEKYSDFSPSPSAAASALQIAPLVTAIAVISTIGAYGK
jgi:hypothetical protein